MILSDKILVIGPSHIDVIANTTNRYKLCSDKVGKITTSLGGTAYNIANQLAINNYPVILATNDIKCYKDYNKDQIEVVSTINNEVLFTNIPCKVGHVAHCCNNQMVSAISAEYSDMKFSEKHLYQLIERSALIIVDCNSTLKLLSKCLTFSKGTNKPVYISGVSSSKMHVGISAAKKVKLNYDCFLINKHEYDYYVCNRVTDNICNQFRSENVIVTDGKRGSKIYSSNGKYEKLTTPILKLRTTIGCGDTYLAAVAASTVDRACFDVSVLNDYVSRFMRNKI
ncbi:PfkB family carbohydrate kinase [Geobacter sp. AOG2]|uniref:PfkB family carbohydrate kinase n=1 Tax=Geobacter sp. AOG2 TaxID=1566347 RepID=UPI001CC6BEF7|nr:PfkB family carbohydrate kinase [Geobacter sp. AOG2]GFE59541.1 hypothetical protein AOG2_01290 [Geobacter sp. AOG2]